MSTIKEVGPQGVLPSGFSWDSEARCYWYSVRGGWIDGSDSVMVARRGESVRVFTSLEDVIAAQTLGEFTSEETRRQGYREHSIDDDSAEMAAEVARQVAALNDRARRVEILERMEEQDRADEAAADRFWEDRRDQWQNGTLSR
tara:strand:+ start:1286 stop:1717 length:432 start_codon:yes stop_codon:yes gene_type:complete